MPERFARPVVTPAADRARIEAGTVRDPRALVSLTTDFGERDASPAICRGVILGIAPDVRLLDVSHEVAKFAVLDGALLLWAALPYLPVGVHVAVVDPGVGTTRLPIGVRVARGDVLVGPDNGLLLPAADRLGGVVAAHVLEAAEFRLPEVSASFHGRDVFAPAGAHLALGVPLEAFGRPLDPSGLVRLRLPEPNVMPGALVTAVIYVDSFGNVKLAGERPDLEAALGRLTYGDPLQVGPSPRERSPQEPSPQEPPQGQSPREPSLGRGRSGPHGPTRATLTWQPTFGAVPPGDPLLYEDSHGRLCLAVAQGDAARRLELRTGDWLAIRRAPPGRAP
ncbi:MAG TPA: SAM-dependent chlorinase/fluorinase [Candidatus Acidoferrales bacterium]|nr:SAM-dependent chlorinase/fluorinase [Candidatus Acidoferrales bacterium]